MLSLFAEEEDAKSMFLDEEVRVFARLLRERLQFGFRDRLEWFACAGVRAKVEESEADLVLVLTFH